MQNTKKFWFHSLVCLGCIAIGSVSTAFYNSYQAYRAQEYKEKYEKAQGLEISKEEETLSIKAILLTKELKSNSLLMAEAVRLMQKAQGVKGPEVYMIRIWKDSFQINARFVYSGACYTITDGCRSENDLKTLGNYPEIERIIPKLPFNSYGWTPKYTLVLREVVEGNKPKIVITVSNM